jgi:hypothetical protein
MTPTNANIFVTNELIEDLLIKQEFDIQNFITERGSGKPYPEDCIKDLVSQLEKLKNKLAGEKFEAAATELVHKTLLFDQQAFSDPGFWRWMTISYFYNLTIWRHPSSPKEDGTSNFNVKNFGIGATTENFLYRIWVRADVAKDDKLDDPYFLAKKEGYDIFMSFIVRRKFANVSNVAKAFLSFCFDTDSERSSKKLNIDGKTQTLYRFLGKSIQRLGANIFFECMDYDQIKQIITNEADKLIQQSATK